MIVRTSRMLYGWWENDALGAMSVIAARDSTGLSARPPVKMDAPTPPLVLTCHARGRRQEGERHCTRRAIMGIGEFRSTYHPEHLREVPLARATEPPINFRDAEPSMTDPNWIAAAEGSVKMS